MKKIKQLGTIAFLALGLSFGSCSSDDSGDSTGGVAADGTITASVDGNSITTLNAATIALKTGNLLNVSGSTMTGESITMVISNFTGNGTYNVITGNDLGAVFTYTKIDLNNPQSTNNTWYAPFDGTTGTSGTITVTESTDQKVKGTFSFKGVNDLGTYKNVTNGSFNVNFTQQAQ